MDLNQLKEKYSTYTYPRLKNNTRLIYERIYRNQLEPRFGTTDITKIKRRDVVEHLDHIHVTKSGSVANNALILLKAMMYWALDREYIINNPCQRVKKPAPVARRDLFLELDQMKILYQVLETSPLGLKYIHKSLQLLMLTGARKSEVEQTKWENWNLDNGTLYLPDSKNRTPKLLPLPTQAVDILTELKRNPPRKNCSYVFPTRNTKQNDHISKDASLHSLKSALKIAGLPTIYSPHDLRRSVTTGVLRLGASEAVAKKILNHKDHSSFSHYNMFTYEKETREALQKLADTITR